MADEFNIQEWIQKAKEDPKIAAQPVVVLLAIVFLGWKFLYSPKKVELEKELKKNKEVVAKIKDLDNAVSNSEEIKLQVAELKKARSEVEKICYQKAEAPMFLQSIRKLGKSAGIDIKSINPLPPITKTYETLTYEEYPVKISFSGNFRQLGIFLRTIETFDKLISVELPPLVPDASGSFKFDLTPTAVLLPEVQPISQPKTE